jgi:hypothetical protein
MYQCAYTTRIARGRGTDSPNARHARHARHGRHARVYRLVSSAFIGLPWPKNAAGMTVEPSTLLVTHPPVSLFAIECITPLTGALDRRQRRVEAEVTLSITLTHIRCAASLRHRVTDLPTQVARQHQGTCGAQEADPDKVQEAGRR